MSQPKDIKEPIEFLVPPGKTLRIQTSEPVKDAVFISFKNTCNDPDFSNTKDYLMSLSRRTAYDHHDINLWTTGEDQIYKVVSKESNEKGIHSFIKVKALKDGKVEVLGHRLIKLRENYVSKEGVDGSNDTDETNSGFSTDTGDETDSTCSTLSHVNLNHDNENNFGPVAIICIKEIVKLSIIENKYYCG
ncbi:hypothetical protein BN7_2771 [Wickerhamomyces ciferrii]|uniref:Uncharacterized protein n=1 Tax=Wickerhamomyces ciferrii (strain ATCC 14091 / BCRC 22168 / CBS 111 / JCM 3599 / NBRC 0793 / NRRL Y-1031 F-60-10) TaxID=1206466 RepID=K0KPB1_WICCF|nr:uncharacterized protein BN7_2771 [Wickerhamomyces ciferrii]CCH43224.1 hypothetical protein BN7_2771 [Wickerhamomyces ciferrii]